MVERRVQGGVADGERGCGAVAGDEKETARQAVAEGQAMVVFVDYAAGREDAGDGRRSQAMKDAGTRARR